MLSLHASVKNNLIKGQSCLERQLNAYMSDVFFPIRMNFNSQKKLIKPT